MWPGMETIAPTLAHDDAVMGNGLIPRDLLASITVPVLSVSGSASPAWLREAARLVAEAAPRGTYRTLEGQAHAVEPEVLAPVLAEFFMS
jgi:pimeloyl-ACP methyl ester carboxylesterase